MPFYHKLGKIPPKRPTQFRQENGKLYQEQLFGTIGFDGMSRNLYQSREPARVANIDERIGMKAEIAVENNRKSRMLKGWDIEPKDDYLESRIPVLVNNDVQLILSAPKKSLRSYFYKNTDADELIFVHKGTGKLRTQFGNIDFKYGDYLLVPRGIIYQIDFDGEDNRLFITESRQPIYTPKRYRNWFGQLLELSLIHI